jgi:hypothetical protein
MQPKRFLSEHVEHLSRGPLAGLDPSVEIPLAVRRGVLPGEQRVPLGLLQEPPEVRVLAGSEPGIRAVHPRIVHPGVKGPESGCGPRPQSGASDRTKDR